MFSKLAHFSILIVLRKKQRMKWKRFYCRKPINKLPYLTLTFNNHPLDFHSMCSSSSSSFFQKSVKCSPAENPHRISPLKPSTSSSKSLCFCKSATSSPLENQDNIFQPEPSPVFIVHTDSEIVQAAA